MTEPAPDEGSDYNTEIIKEGAQTFTVLAEELVGAARAELWPKLVAEYSTLGEHQAKTTRQFPVFMLTRQD